MSFEFSYGTITVNGSDLVYNDTVYSLDQINGNLTLTIDEVSSAVPVAGGNAEGVFWENISGNDFVLQYSTDSFENILQIETDNNAVDTLGLPEGTYQWRVKSADGVFVNGEDIISETPTTPKVLVSDDDNDMDVFFANVNGIWTEGYGARHQQISNIQIVKLVGKNNIVDIFEGSTEENVLVLTDTANGDVLFVDDIYSAAAKEGARLVNINEIRAGAGDDVIDFTSSRYAYFTGGMKIYGGSGDDVIWSADGENRLFGDAGDDNIVGGSGNDIIVGGIGNDTLHGGGGDDIFCFGGNFGNDIVNQLDGGSVTLYFDSEDVQWDEGTNSYTDGRNSVTLNGDFEVTVHYETPAELSSIGAFDDFTSEKIFEDKPLVA